ncbi:hypothetical protein [Alsobacter soli]|nr:hypothetical protein [Alsobacter soli]
MIRQAAVVLAAVGSVMAAGMAQAASFDGNWSVLLTTSKGNCDKAYRFPVLVSGGRISYAGQSGATAQGGVNPSGQVSARFARGGDTLAASGRVKGDFGMGTWQSPTRECAGSWTAEKR